MKGVGQQSSYSALPQQPMSGASAPSKASNAVNLSGRTLDELVQDFSKATGSDEAELRVHYDEGNVHFIVPSSASGTPSLWTKFKAALSDLPLLNKVASLRAAKIEVDSLPLQVDDLRLLNGIRQAVENSQHEKLPFNLRQHFSDDARAQLESQPLTKRHVVQVLTSTIDGINQRRTRIDRDADTATIERSPREPAQQSRKPAAKNFPAGLPKWLEPHVGHRDPALFAECAKTVAERVDRNDRAQIGAEAQKLYAQAQEFLVARGRWPVKDMDDVVMSGLVATLDVTNRGD